MTSTPDPQGQGTTRVYAAVVSLVRAAERRALMARELAAAGVAADFFDACDGRAQENAAALAAMPDHGPWGAVAMHAKACTRSHLLLMEQFLARDEDYCLVLEDDAFLSPDLQLWLADMSWWPAGADIVKIERWRDDKLFVALGRDGRTHLGRTVAPLLSRHSGTAGYIVSRAGAAKIVAARRIDMPIDHLLFNVNISALARGLDRWQVSPALVVQGNEPPAAAAPAAPQQPLENKTLRELRRSWHEVKLLPKFLGLLATGRASFQKIAYAPDATTTNGGAA
ncbi:glycosyltransferase family 25 protein [Chachezhania sediminis]|uniref:glycosyltransferase family 25 protein n=1 Tax=Chachezhania sediminis TaxID=2599291 RepID=UPI00131E9480|nr:glycosyltransferase family 25 protein [Chachezhania sediminis]